MSKLLIALFVTAGLGLAGPAAAQMYAPTTHSAPTSKDAYNLATTKAEAQYTIDKEACAPRSGNAKDECMVKAKGKESVAKAEATAAHENSPKARENLRVARAQASYDVAIERCDALSENRKDACTREAKADLIKGKAHAKVDRVASDVRRDAMSERTEARNDANAEKSETGIKTASEKCDMLTGPAKGDCPSNAKTQ
jgi:hypothetical protein